MLDLLGEKTIDRTFYILFHDESICNASKFLYHGFLFVKEAEATNIGKLLEQVKREQNKETSEIHFNELKNKSNSQYGAKTRIAIDWLNKSKQWLESNYIKFYCFGVNKNNVKNFWTNPNSYDKNVYLRFFEIGLKSAIRWFNIEQISWCYLDKGTYDKERRKRIKWLNDYFRTSRPRYNINADNVILLDSDENKSKSELSNLIQLCDVILGTIRLSFVKTSSEAQSECVKNFIDIIEMFNCESKAYDCKNNIYYKKFCISFFPTKSDLTKESFLKGGIEAFRKRGQFYCDRLTFRQQLAQKQNLKLNI
ncbi:MAG: DUF3800 domain-containing protein [candidate division WOR-3 bacterium]